MNSEAGTLLIPWFLLLCYLTGLFGGALVIFGGTDRRIMKGIGLMIFRIFAMIARSQVTHLPL